MTISDTHPNARWTPAEKAEMARLWRSGKKVAEIAKVLGKSQSAVKNQRRKSKELAPRKRGGPKVQVRVSIHQDEHALIRKKALRSGQTVPGRIRTLIEKDLGTP